LSASDREKIYRHLRSVWGVETNTKLMNHLQDAGLVSDNCASIDEVADSDLMRAYNATFAEESQQ
jgi:hypothetical protein